MILNLFKKAGIIPQILISIKKIGYFPEKDEEKLIWVSTKYNELFFDDFHPSSYSILVITLTKYFSTLYIKNEEQKERCTAILKNINNIKEILPVMFHQIQIDQVELNIHELNNTLRQLSILLEEEHIFEENNYKTDKKIALQVINELPEVIKKDLKEIIKTKSLGKLYTLITANLRTKVPKYKTLENLNLDYLCIVLEFILEHFSHIFQDRESLHSVLRVSITSELVMIMANFRCTLIIPRFTIWLSSPTTDEVLRHALAESLIELGSRKEIIPILRQYNQSYRIADILSSLSTETRDQRLYSGVDDEKFWDQKRNIVRKDFNKTGSETILLGGKLAGKVIIRVVSERALLTWKKALESEIWKKEGFDYIPIEPILTKNGKLRAYKTVYGEYRVYTKVLGPNLVSFLTNPENRKYSKELYILRGKIIRALEEIEISHGHDHEFNFCISKEDDEIKLYMIDFDQSISK
ncbi:MAG: hypothetical protein AABW52_03330 [Nanoarchaeota archaeon]